MYSRSIIYQALLAGLFVTCGDIAAALSADMAIKAPPASGCAQAVDGVNGKIGALGGTFGSFGDKSLGEAQGSLSMPLGCSFGAQIDFDAGSFDNRFIGTVAGHLFWRDPSKGLVGAYGDFTKWDQFGSVRAGHVGPEGEAYLGQFTLQGVAGVEFGNTTSGVIGPALFTFNVPTRFFDQANVAFYPTENLEVYAGHRYLGGRNAAAFGGEFGISAGHGIMAALFAEGVAGENGYHGAWGGLRFYFGQKDKSLIRRHREDDPTNWDNGPAATANNMTQTPVSTGSVCDPCGPPL